MLKKKYFYCENGTFGTCFRYFRRRQSNGHRRNLKRMTRYANNAFDMNDVEFRQNYRVNKAVFEMIYQDLYPLMPPTTRRSDISTKYKVCKRFYIRVSKFHM